jgi:hypothetical protein
MPTIGSGSPETGIGRVVRNRKGPHRDVADLKTVSRLESLESF